MSHRLDSTIHGAEGLLHAGMQNNLSRINQGLDEKIGKLSLEIRNQENDHIQKSQTIVEQKI